MTILQSSDVRFVPDRMTPQFGDLSVATATTLANTFGECPHCGATLNLDTTDGLAEDRDVVFEDRDPDRFDHPRHRMDARRTDAHTCDECGGRANVLVEEKAQPAHYSELDDQLKEYGYVFVEMDDKDGYLVVNPSAIYVTPIE